MQWCCTHRLQRQDFQRASLSAPRRAKEWVELSRAAMMPSKECVAVLVSTMCGVGMA